MNTQTDTERITFQCSCKGCRQRTADYQRISYGPDALAAELEGYYFTAETRRFFGSRILAVRTVPGGGAAIVESKYDGFDRVGREYRVTYWCPFGCLVDSLTDRTYKTSATAHKYSRDMATAATVIGGCDCHGCQIARQAGK